jgi:hypothetical protein
VANKAEPVLAASVEELRQWLKVPENKLNRWPDLRRFALEPALKQINGNAVGAGFSVEMTTEKKGRAVKKVVFRVMKPPERLALDKKLKSREAIRDFFDAKLKLDTYEKAGKYVPGWDIYGLEAEWREWGEQQADWPPENPDGAFVGFCKKRGEFLMNAASRKTLLPKVRHIQV